MTFLDGAASLFAPPSGGDANRLENADLDANDFYVWSKSRWLRCEPQSAGAGRPFGWINSPQ